LDIGTTEGKRATVTKEKIPPPDTIVFTSFNVITGWGGWFTINVPYFCQQCGQCCKDLSYPDPESFNNVTEAIKINIQQLIRRFTKNGQKRDDTDIVAERCQKKPCIFLQDDLCLIYSMRPLLCREWYPRVKSKCPAYHLHNEMSQTLVQNRRYHIGVREVIFIGKKNPNPIYPHVEELKKIDKKTLLQYYAPTEEEAKYMWTIFLTFNPRKQEKEIFEAINPVIKKLPLKH
jgi:Fe-S-cluster containining protein